MYNQLTLVQGYSLQQAIQEVNRVISIYNNTRQNDPYNYAVFQDCRDDMSQMQIYFSNQVAEYRSAYEDAEEEYKIALSIRDDHWRDQLGNARGTAAKAEAKAKSECEGLRKAMSKKREMYYGAKYLSEALDKALDSMGSRIRPAMKHLGAPNDMKDDDQYKGFTI